jgi:hypothetical protein
MCSSHPPENGADSDPALWVHEQGTLPPTDLYGILVSAIGKRPLPTWVKRAVHGGWDHPAEEVSE